ncbi:MAG: hypothetical protein EZS28_027784 [Streblomastix strix]|uniref:Uncharacterized protein n=1 Tax=Streblomastix strix TaxID=222440 RepID=A0A5J4V1S7_9EUKA|nr:MAG: hypothetical protein EZS28_027784 [Streblomastix strix]
MKLTPDGLLIVNNIQLINNDFLQKIIILEQQVQNIQQQINGYSQDIGQLQADVQVINTELARQTHFRGYFTTNDEILELNDPAIGDYAYSAEDLLVWDYDGSQWVETDKIVPDQMTPASDANPLSDGTVTAGTSAEYSRGDHIHPLNISTSVPISDTADGAVGTSVNYSRSDHSHHINISSTTPLQDNDGSVGTANSYARSDHQHPINVETNASNIPIVDGVGVNGSSTFYSRHDHVHPQQLTYDGNVTATKFIKTGGTNEQLLLANGDTKPIIYATRQFLITTPKKYVKLCTLNPQLQENCISVEFQVRGRSGFGLLQFHQRTSTPSGLAGYGYHFQPNYQDCMQEAYALYFGTGTTRTCELWVLLQIQSNQVVIDYTNRGTIASLITDILTSSPVDDLPTDYTTMITLTPNLQFDDRTINNAPFTQKGVLQVNSNGNNYNQGIRIARSTNNYCGIYLACDPNSTTGTLSDQWNISVFDTGELKIALGAQVMQANRGLMISADGNTLSFNGTVIAGTGASNGGDSSVTYSQGKAVQWGTNSTQSGGLYASGQNLYWNARTVLFSSVSP